MLLEHILGRFSLTVLVALKTGFAVKTRNLSIPSSPLSDINSKMKGCGYIRMHVYKEVRLNPCVPVERTLWSPLPPPDVAQQRSFSFSFGLLVSD